MKLPEQNYAPAATRSGLIVGFYSVLGLVAILISASIADVDIYRLADVSTPSRLALSPLLGLFFGLFVVWLSRRAVRHFRWATQLHLDFRSLLGPLTNREILVLAFASSVGEELMFRGALQPLIGLWLQAGVFSLLHIGRGLRFLPWTISAFVLGVALGYMFRLTGDLGGPIVAHFTINFLNLHFIVRGDVPSLRDVQGREGTV